MQHVTEFARDLRCNG